MAHSNAHTLDEVRAAKPRALAVFEGLATVVGVGITQIGGGFGLKVNLREHPGADTQLPTEVDGVPVQIEVIDKPQKQ
ncbi:hypothetical protein [Fimbriiglobus ruber]|uniref:hypothetical protein n=1 Tax=Fimbriiglobus ruber TaxID=1908690 RepID=UPI00117A4499|nr:hypothetical protein [Fimbriiglobus ruber]